MERKSTCSMPNQPYFKAAEVKASSPIRTSLYEREGSMWGSLKQASPRRIASNLAYALKCHSYQSELCQEMLTTFGFTPEQMHRATDRFLLGKSKSGKTIYWLIDELAGCLDGRLGDTWFSEILKARYPVGAPYLRVQHCFFGLHQISMIDDKPIGIVESARSAVILSELCPHLLWLAYIYTSNLTIDKFEPLQGRKITIFPRSDPYMDHYIFFLELADQLKRRYPAFDITVSTFLEDHATDAQKQRNIDILDFMCQS